MGPNERKGDELDNEEHDNTESSQGEEEVDEMDDDADIEVVTPGATASRHGMQVAKLDQQEFWLTGGKWAGKGAVQKAVEI